jgi:Tfp pilus assembly protein PilF
MGEADQYDDLSQKARQAINDGNPALARQLYMQALAIRSGSADANYGVATACFLIDEPESAIFYFKESLRLDPQRAGAYVNLGAVYSRMGNLEEAVKSLRKAIQIDPKRAEAYYNLGLIYRRQNQSELAVQAYREALHLNPQMPDAHYNLANVLLDVGRYGQAATHYQNVLEMNPNFENAKLGLEQAKAAQQREAAPQPASTGHGSGVRHATVNLNRTLDPQLDGAALHALHHATIEVENQGREFANVLETELEVALKELSTVLLYPEKTSGELNEKLERFELALSHLRSARRVWQKTMKSIHDTCDKMTAPMTT